MPKALVDGSFLVMNFLQILQNFGEIRDILAKIWDNFKKLSFKDYFLFNGYCEICLDKSLRK